MKAMPARLSDGTSMKVLGNVPKAYREYAGRQGKITTYCEGWYWVLLNGEPKHRGTVLHLRRYEIEVVEG